jgi:hypothetical protein
VSGRKTRSWKRYAPFGRLCDSNVKVLPLHLQGTACMRSLSTIVARTAECPSAVRWVWSIQDDDGGNDNADDKSKDDKSKSWHGRCSSFDVGRDGFGSSTVDYVELAAADFDALPLLVPKEQVHYRRRILHGSSPGTGCLYIHSGECLLPLSSVWKIEPVSIGFFWCILRQLWWGLSLWSAPKLSFGELLSGFTAFTPDTVATGWTHCCRSLGKQNGRPLVMEARHRRDQCREGGPRMRDTRVSFNSQDVLPGA